MFKRKSPEKWNEVIRLAREKIETLERAVAAFERFKMNGDPFPSEPQKTESEAA